MHVTRFEYKMIQTRRFDGVSAVLGELNEAGGHGFHVVADLDSHVLLQRAIDQEAK